MQFINKFVVYEPFPYFYSANILKWYLKKNGKYEILGIHCDDFNYTIKNKTCFSGLFNKTKFYFKNRKISKNNKAEIKRLICFENKSLNDIFDDIIDKINNDKIVIFTYGGKIDKQTKEMSTKIHKLNNQLCKLNKKIPLYSITDFNDLKGISDMENKILLGGDILFKHQYYHTSDENYSIELNKLVMRLTGIDITKLVRKYSKYYKQV